MKTAAEEITSPAAVFHAKQALYNFSYAAKPYSEPRHWRFFNSQLLIRQYSLRRSTP